MLNDVPQKARQHVCTQLDRVLCKFASLHLIIQNVPTFPAIEEHAPLSFALTHCICILNSVFNTFLCSTFIVGLLMFFQTGHAYILIIKEMLVYVGPI